MVTDATERCVALVRGDCISVAPLKSEEIDDTFAEELLDDDGSSYRSHPQLAEPAVFKRPLRSLIQQLEAPSTTKISSLQAPTQLPKSAVFKRQH